MLIVLILYFLILVSLVATFIFTKKFLRLFSATLIAILILPLCFLVFLGIFKDKIQQGRLLPQLGTLLLLVSPPKDLWVPLASDVISHDRKEYGFLITHKYVGNHDVFISFKPLESMEVAENDFKVRIIMEKDGKVLYDKTSQKGQPFWSKDDSGLTFHHYKVPEDLPIHTPINAKIYIDGDIDTFIKHYGAAKIVVGKGSDI